MAKNIDLVFRIEATLEDCPKEIRFWFRSGITDTIDVLDTEFYFNDGKRTHIDQVRQLKDALCREDVCTLILTKEYSIFCHGKPVDRLTIEKFVKKAPNLNWPTAYASQDVNATGELYRTFQVTPEKVIFNDPATIVFWKDGTKTVVKCMEGDIYNSEVGLAMCVCKKVFDKKYHKFFKYYMKDAPTRPLLGNVTEATAASYYSPVDEVIDMIKAVFEDTKGESK